MSHIMELASFAAAGRVDLVMKCGLLWLALLTEVKFAGSEMQDGCKHVFYLAKGKNVDLHLHNFTQSGVQQQYCTLQVSTDKAMRVVLDLVYVPASPTRKLPADCSSDYVHVGNDKERVDVNLMTSYKFCGEDVRHELISRSNHMWLVYKASQTPKHLYVKVQAQAPVKCTTDEFACSPVQCVDRSRVCDEIQDCTNGHDEFCHRRSVNSLPPSPTESCFRCGDGTCIQPRLSRYDISYGRVLWYLCDGFSHCPDAWDEREDICLRLKTGRLDSVTECVPSDLQFGPNGTIMMWNEIRCDDNPDCYHGDDEDGCYGKNSRGNKLRADPVTIGVVVAVVIVGCLIAFVIYRMKTAKPHIGRPSTSSTMDTMCTQCTSVTDDHCGVEPNSQTYDEECTASHIKRNHSIDESNEADGDGDDGDDEEGSVCAVTLNTQLCEADLKKKR